MKEYEVHTLEITPEFPPRCPSLRIWTTQGLFTVDYFFDRVYLGINERTTWHAVCGRLFKRRQNEVL